MLPRPALVSSLKLRIALSALALVLAGIWALAGYADHRLRAGLGAQIEAQQLSIAGLLARELERTLQERRNALLAVARSLADMAADRPAQLQERLANLPALQQMFDGGFYVVDGAGAMQASFPLRLWAQPGVETQAPFVQQALAGHVALGTPAQHTSADHAVLSMAVPMPVAGNGVPRAVVGLVKLRESGLLGPIVTPGSESASDYYVVDRGTRTIIASSVPGQLMQSLEPEGRDAVIDRFIDGGEGNAVYHDPVDGTLLVAVRQLGGARWLVAVAQQAVQVFAPLNALRNAIALAALALTLLTAAGLWWMLRRELRPLEDMARRLAAMARGERALAPLPQVRSDEIGQLVQGFNRLLQELQLRQRERQESEARYRSAFRTSPDALDITRVSDGSHLDVNDGYEQLFGWPREQVLGRSGLDLGIWRDEKARTALVAQVLRDGGCRNSEQTLYHRDGRALTVLMSASLLDVGGEPCFLWVTHDVTDYRRAHAQIQQLTFIDSLTGLPNRSQFMQCLEMALALCQTQQRLGALLYLDLHEFRAVNDTLGHAQGDRLLRSVAERLRDALTEAGTGFRLGGDEFMVLLEGLPDTQGEAAHEAERLAERLLAALAPPIDLAGLQQHCSVSVGIVVFGDGQDEPLELLRRADLALNQAKEAGPSTILFFEPQMLEEVSSRARLQRDLREALQRQDFALHYQPQLALDGTVVGVEALIRWRLEGHGMVSPMEFIPLAEKTGLILPLGRWILHTACRQLAAWARHGARRHLTMAVNVSAGQFQQEDFVQQVREALVETGAPAHRLKLELTESLMLQQIEAVIARMRELQALGVQFSLDDFGTGFSSLAYLKRLPLAQLKIDQGFVRDILEDHNDAAIAQTVIALGHSLGLEVIAEGVETEQHRALLAQWGCRFYQGYLFSRPLSAEALQDWLDAQPPQE